MQRLNSAIIYDRDFTYQYFGFKTLERSYLLKIDGKGVSLGGWEGATDRLNGGRLLLQWPRDLNIC